MGVFAWLVLWRWGHLPYVHYHCHAAAGAGVFASALFFASSWTLMTVAMMLPTSVPLIALFQRVASGRADRSLLVALVIGGYLLVWLAFGALAQAAMAGWRFVVGASPWLSDHAWLLAAVTLALAGLYQFTPLKYRCLDKCRSPLGFVIEHWTGRNCRAQALWLGMHHGLFCVGCCWTLMLLMFPIGSGNVGWMLALGAVMAIEKNLPSGRRLGPPIGVLLLGFAGWVVVFARTPF
jgi:predicted metal-binding membrane protein